MLRTLTRIFAITVLLSIELYAVYAVLHPHVTAEYRAYYMDRTMGDWCPNHYPGTPESGINFAKPCWPDFVRLATGFSSREPWGRWTDSGLAQSPTILMQQRFNGPVCIEFVGRPSTAEKGRVLEIALGENSSSAVLANPDFTTYALSFDNAKAADSLVFRFPNKVPPDIDVSPGSHDPRGLGIGLVSLRILPHTCTSDSGNR